MESVELGQMRRKILVHLETSSFEIETNIMDDRELDNYIYELVLEHAYEFGLYPYPDEMYNYEIL